MDATTITFEVLGPPVPQPRARWANGHTYTPTKNGINILKAAVALQAAAVARRAGWQAGDGPHAIDIECVFERPPSHVMRSGELRAGSPSFPGMRAGDWDNLAKGVQDAITTSRAVWHDDTQVVDGRCRKRYAARGELARTVVTITRLPDAAPS